MDQLEFLVEEPSIAEVLKGVLPQILPNGWRLNENCFIRIHSGKQDLCRSVPKKLRAARHRAVRSAFVIVIDQDSNDCLELKRDLVSVCNRALAGADNVFYLVRIVCHELESWYLGDHIALGQVFSQSDAFSLSRRALFRIPDRCVNPKQELKRIVGEYPQIETARCFARTMLIENNRSKSFMCFVDGVRSLLVHVRGDDVSTL